MDSNLSAKPGKRLIHHPIGCSSQSIEDKIYHQNAGVLRIYKSRLTEHVFKLAFYFIASLSYISNIIYTMSAKPVLLVLGAGSNIGKALALKFSSAGYGIALAARSIADGITPEGHLGIKVDLSDLSDPSSIVSDFAKVKSTLGTPNTIIYNAANVSPPPDPENIFSLPLETLQKDINIMNNSAFSAAKEAVAGFDTLPKEMKKTFIYTGNILSTKVLPVPSLVTLGIGKSAAAYWVGLASSSFASKGYRSVP
jgi:hypothetical protein